MICKIEFEDIIKHGQILYLNIENNTSSLFGVGAYFIKTREELRERKNSLSSRYMQVTINYDFEAIQRKSPLSKQKYCRM